MQVSRFTQNGNFNDTVLRPAKPNGINWRLHKIKTGPETVLRVMPYIEPDGSIQPLITDVGAYDGTNGEELLTDAFVCFEMVSFWGAKKLSFITEVTDPSAPETNRTPAKWFASVVQEQAGEKAKNPQNAPAEWRYWATKVAVPGYSFKSSMVEYPQTTFAFRALRLAGRPTTGAGGKPLAPLVGPDYIIATLSSTTANAFVKAIYSPADSNQPFSVANSTYGDIVGLNGNTIKLVSVASQSLPGMPANRSQELTLGTVAGMPYPMPHQEMLRVFQPWSELLNYISIEAQISLIAQAFTPGSVKAALSDSPYVTYFPDEVKSADAPRFGEVIVPGWTPPAQQPYGAPAVPQYQAPPQNNWQQPPQQYVPPQAVAQPPQYQQPAAQPAWAVPPVQEQHAPPAYQAPVYTPPAYTPPPASPAAPQQYVPPAYNEPAVATQQQPAHTWPPVTSPVVNNAPPVAPMMPPADAIPMSYAAPAPAPQAAPPPQVINYTQIPQHGAIDAAFAASEVMYNPKKG